MRAVILLALMLLAAPAFAGDWGRYDNSRFGYGIDIPPGFTGQGEAESGDGQVFRDESGTQVLTVFGGNIVDTDFAGEVAQRQQWAAGDGWALTYQAVTQSWASYSGKRGGRVLYARMIALCDRTQFAMFELSYFDADMVALDRVVSRLVASLKSAGCH